LKISADLFGSLEITLSAQLSFENLYEFGLRTLSMSMADPFNDAERFICV
jgi:hypothetical protein